MRDVSGSQVNIALLRGWLDACERNHGSCRQPKHEETRTLPLLLIDSKERRLVNASSAFRYLALSYVWGGTSQFKTTKEALATLKTKGSLKQIEDEIPQVIKDAIDLVSSLGERYLWVDSLSITQDDEQQKHDQIAEMASVYHHAVLTIVAMGGKDASSGLPGFRPQSRVRSGVEVAPGVWLAPRTRKLSSIISQSVYNTRAWTYQERLLSKRCLFFTEEQVFFQCSDTKVQCEDRLEGFSENHQLVAPLAAATPLNPSIRQSVLNEPFPYYARFVMEYTRKTLSYEADIINAFTGLPKCWR
jgi:hypothetical protein